MIQELLTVLISLIFLFIGYYLGCRNSTTTEKPASQQVDKPVKPKKNLLEKAGIIEYANQADIDYVKNGEDKIDEARNKAFRENFRT